MGSRDCTIWWCQVHKANRSCFCLKVREGGMGRGGRDCYFWFDPTDGIRGFYVGRLIPIFGISCCWMQCSVFRWFALSVSGSGFQDQNDSLVWSVFFSVVIAIESGRGKKFVIFSYLQIIYVFKNKTNVGSCSWPKDKCQSRKQMSNVFESYWANPLKLKGLRCAHFEQITISRLSSIVKHLCNFGFFILNILAAAL